MFKPTGPRPDSGKPEAVTLEQSPQMLDLQSVRGRRKNFHGIEPQRRRPGAAAAEPVPEDERPATRPRHQRDGNGRTHRPHLPTLAWSGARPTESSRGFRARFLDAPEE